jgi:hypothetical protein
LLLATSVKYKNWSNTLLFIVFLLITSRQIIRILDLEGTKGDSIMEEDFRFLVTSQIIATYACLVIYFSSFKASKIKALFGFLMSVFCYICTVVENYGFENGNPMGFAGKWMFILIVGFY